MRDFRKNGPGGRTGTLGKAPPWRKRGKAWGNSPRSWAVRPVHGVSPCGGTSLVELVVSMLVLGIILGMIVGILSPAAGAEAGDMLEFVSPQGYIALVSAGGCGETRILVDGTEIETARPVEPGQLLMRYYVNSPPADGSASWQYACRDGEGPVARAVQGVFGDGFYMGNELEVQFRYPADGGNAVPDGGAVSGLEAEVSLYGYRDGQRELLVQERGIRLDFRYAVKRHDSPTAQAAP